MRKFLLLLTFLASACWLSSPAWAQRSLPAAGKRAETGAQQLLPMVMLGNDVRRLAPGGVIIDANNRSITHGQLLPGMDVLYVLDRNNEIERIIILKPEEQARLDQATR